jgi:hypothetical protein
LKHLKIPVQGHWNYFNVSQAGGYLLGQSYSWDIKAKLKRLNFPYLDDNPSCIHNLISLDNESFGYM